MFMLDDGEIYGWLVLGMANLAVLAAAAGAVVRTVLRQRARENAYRMRMARWHAAVPGPELPSV